jgi:hypothetical protein
MSAIRPVPTLSVRAVSAAMVFPKNLLTSLFEVFTMPAVNSGECSKPTYCIATIDSVLGYLIDCQQDILDQMTRHGVTQPDIRQLQDYSGAIDVLKDYQSNGLPYTHVVFYYN